MNTTTVPPSGTDTASPAVQPPREPPALRVLRSIVCIVLAVALIVLTGLATIGLIPLVREAFEPFYLSHKQELSRVAIGLSFAFIVLAPLALLGFAARRRLLRWPVLGVACVALIPVFVWLAADEPGIRIPLTIDEFSPPFPGADQSFATLMRFSKRSTSQESKTFDATKFAVTWTADASTRDAAKYRAFVLKHRAGIEADWAALAPQRQWLDALAAYDRIGDLTPARLDADIMKFSVPRTLSQRLCAVALLQALDGRGDEACATLRPLLHVSRRLQTSSRTLVRTMIAVVMERMAIETALMVLDLAPPSAAAKASLVAALGPENGSQLARRIILIEYAAFAPAVIGESLGTTIGGANSGLSRRVLNSLSALIYNPNASMNLYGEHLHQLATLAETRALGEFAVRSKTFDQTITREPGMKNLAGRMVLHLAIPSFEKVINSHWETADLRVKLRQRVAA